MRFKSSTVHCCEGIYNWIEFILTKNQFIVQIDQEVSEETQYMIIGLTYVLYLTYNTLITQAFCYLSQTEVFNITAQT